MLRAIFRRSNKKNLICLFVIVVLLLIVWKIGCRCPTEDSSGELWVLGLDGADWRNFTPLMRMGRIPVFQSLHERGLKAQFHSFEPMISPLIWTSIATGREPTDHGITDFMAVHPETGEEIPITSWFKKVPSVWNILSERGIGCTVIGWWATWPAESINGFMVTDRYRPHILGMDEFSMPKKRIAYPSDLYGELMQHRERTDSGPWPAVPLSKTIKKENGMRKVYPSEQLWATYNQTEEYGKAALHLLEKARTEFFTLYLQGTDTLGHLFNRYYLPQRASEEAKTAEEILLPYFSFQDSWLEKIFNEAEADTYVMIISDHGFKWRANPPSGRKENPLAGIESHLIEGMFLGLGPGFETSNRDNPLSVMDIAPTILNFFGLPAAENMPGQAIEPFLKSSSPPRIPDYGQQRETGEGEEWLEEAEDSYGKRKLEALGYVVGDTAERHYNLGFLYFKKSDFISASKEFKKALDMGSAKVETLFNLALSLHMIDKKGEAEKYYRLALAKEPENPRFLHHLGELLISIKPEEAVSYLKKVLISDAGRPGLHYDYARALIQVKKYAEAEKHLGIELRNKPDEPVFYLDMGNVKARLGKFDEALKYYNKVLSMDENNYKAQHNRALILRKMRRD